MRFYLSLLIIFIPVIAFSQANYLNGYVVTAKGDTVNGFIDYGDWNYNPHKINFKTAANQLQKYTPGQINYFEIEGVNAYKSYHGPITLDNTKDNNYFLDTDRVGVNIFLRVLQKGKNLSLFVYNDKVNVRYFIQETGSQVVIQLVEHGGGVNRTDYLGAQNPYKIQLTNEAAKFKPANDDLLNEIDYADYTEVALEGVITKINGNDYYKLKKKKVKKGAFFIGAGVNISSAAYTGSYVTNNSSKNSYLPKVDLGSDFFLDPYVKKIVFRVELSFTASKQTFNTNTVYDAVTRYNAYTAMLNPQILYHIYNGDAFKVYLGAGVSANYVTYNNLLDSYGNALVKDNDLVKTYFCFPLRAGVIFNRHIEVSVTYIDFNLINVERYYGINNSLIQVGVNYLFQ